MHRTAFDPARTPPFAAGPLRVVMLVLMVLLGLASVVSHAMEYRGVERFSKDFAVDYASARALVHGADPYAPIKDLVRDELDAPADVVSNHVFPGGNWHPPFKIVTIAPFAALSFRAAGVLWLLLSAASFVWASVLIGDELGWRRSVSLAAGFGILALPIVQKDLSAAQINGPLLVLVVAGWRFLRHDHDLAAGVCLGAAAALKGFPAFLLLVPLGARKFRTVGIAAATAIATNFAAMAWIGFGRIGEVRAIGADGLAYWDGSPANISWWAVATRWLTKNGWVPHVDLGALGTAVAIAGSLLCVALALRPRARLSGDPFWAAAPLMLLALPIVWDHYLILALPWVLLSARRVMAGRGPGTLLAFGLVGLGLVLGIPPGVAALDRTTGVEVALLYQLPTVALIGAVLLDRFARSEERLLPAAEVVGAA